MSSGNPWHHHRTMWTLHSCWPEWRERSLTSSSLALHPLNIMPGNKSPLCTPLWLRRYTFLAVRKHSCSYELQFDCLDWLFFTNFCFPNWKVIQFLLPQLKNRSCTCSSPQTCTFRRLQFPLAAHTDSAFGWTLQCALQRILSTYLFTYLITSGIWVNFYSSRATFLT